MNDAKADPSRPAGHRQSKSCSPRAFEPDFPPAVPQQLAQIAERTLRRSPLRRTVRDLRSLLWSSIDNDTSKDLDQIEVAERLPDGSVKVMVGIADVDALRPQDSPIDQHAARETTTVYTGIKVNFPDAAQRAF
jgi:exoribonuclease II